MRYHFPGFDLTSDTAQWFRVSTQTEDASEDFNNPQTGETYNSNNGLPNPGFYGPLGSGEAFAHEDDPSRQFSEEVKASSNGGGRLAWVTGVFYSHFHSVWDFTGTTPTADAYLDLGTFDRATTTDWFDAVSPTTEDQYAVYGDATYAITPRLKASVGVRWTDYEYSFSSVISGWGSGLGAATPSNTGLIKLSSNSATPKFNLSYQVSPDLMVYGAVFAPYNYTNGKWPTTYNSDSVWSYELGEKASFLNQRLIFNASIYYEDWSNIQLEAYPGDFVQNINGIGAKIYGPGSATGSASTPRSATPATT